MENIINYDSEKASEDILGNDVKTSGGIPFALNDKGGDKVERASWQEEQAQYDDRRSKQYVADRLEDSELTWRLTYWYPFPLMPKGERSLMKGGVWSWLSW